MNSPYNIQIKNTRATYSVIFKGSLIEEGTRGRRSYIPLIRRAPVKDKYILHVYTELHAAFYSNIHVNP